MALGCFSQLTGVVLAISSYLNNDRSASWLLAQLFYQLRNAPRMTLWFGAVLLLLAYLVGVRLAAGGDERRLRVALLGEQAAAFFLAIILSALISMRSGTFTSAAITAALLVSVCGAVLTAGMLTCPVCRRRRWNALLLRSRCNDCGHELILCLRAWIQPRSPEPLARA